MTQSQRLVVNGGAVTIVKVELQRIDAAAKYEFPTRTWIPWSVASGGAAIGLVGLAVWLAGRDQLDGFRENFKRDCPNGCALDDEPALRDQRDSALFKGTFGAAMMITGGAALVGGAVWALAFNKPRRVLPMMETSSRGATIGARWSF
jgi:hypothetical protein